MRTNLIVAIVAGGCVLGFQASAFAQGAAAYPNTAPVFTEPTPIAPELDQALMCAYCQHSRITTNTTVNTAINTTTITATITASIAGKAAECSGVIGRRQ